MAFYTFIIRDEIFILFFRQDINEVRKKLKALEETLAKGTSGFSAQLTSPNNNMYVSPMTSNTRDQRVFRVDSWTSGSEDYADAVENFEDAAQSP